MPVTVTFSKFWEKEILGKTEINKPRINKLIRNLIRVLLKIIFILIFYSDRNYVDYLNENSASHFMETEVNETV